jgi:hypothetical protein
MEFASNPRYVDWKGKKFSTACKTWSGCCDSTNLEKALALLLKTAVDNQVPASDMVDTILLVSDMQFDSGVTCGHHQYGYQDGATARAKLSVVDAAMAQFVAAGYKPPQIVYWNLAGHEGNQATVFSKDTALVSGFSPSILTAVLSGHMDPLGVLNRAIAKYEVFIPASAVTA